MVKGRLFLSSKATPPLKRLIRRAAVLLNACVLGESYHVRCFTSRISFNLRDLEEDAVILRVL